MIQESHLEIRLKDREVPAMRIGTRREIFDWMGLMRNIFRVCPSVN